MSTATAGLSTKERVEKWKEARQRELAGLPPNMMVRIAIPVGEYDTLLNAVRRGFGYPEGLDRLENLLIEAWNTQIAGTPLSQSSGKDTEVKQ
jgi:hypothetical protein